MNIENIDLVSIVQANLKDSISEVASNIFINDPIVKDSIGKPTVYQRVLLNRYFTNLLLIYRTISDVPVHNTTIMLVNDGLTEDWIKLFNTIVLPFLKDNQVFNAVYA